jgi:hypothetical protein
MAMIPFYSQLRSLQFLRTHESHGAQPRMPSEDLSLNGAKIVADIGVEVGSRFRRSLA